MSTPPPFIFSRLYNQVSLPQHQEEAYDVPRPSPNLKILRQLQQSNIISSTINSSLHLSERLGPSKRTTFVNTTDYDVPRRNPIPIKKHHPLPVSVSLTSSCSSPTPSSASNLGLVNYDLPLANPKQVINKNGMVKELPLELQAAIEALDKLQNEAVTAIIRYICVLFFSINYFIYISF